ncbi:hypothetical protein HIM_03523 [Hirsutella minnesotensis 3608]|uniref:Uncharacterized protein n=1 Tax=Hirsutella minnesotensis 3608 TaxID=1043627 RepID=A0A0F8A2R6_9HYPO|nr:hypothetical protein HIM_03523 [Hirsutella minnesotensis 3608]
MSGKDLEEHAKGAWSDEAPDEQFCVYKPRGESWAWMQILGRANFCKIIDYLDEDGGHIDGKFFRILDTNETQDLVLRVDESDLPRNHVLLYDELERVINADNVVPDGLGNAKRSCRHAAHLEVVHETPMVCKHCWADMHLGRTILFKDKEHLGNHGEEFWTVAPGKGICGRHWKTTCLLCSPTLAYGWRQECGPRDSSNWA